jgi:hypothetical protein
MLSPTTVPVPCLSPLPLSAVLHLGCADSAVVANGFAEKFGISPEDVVGCDMVPLQSGTRR